MISKKTLMEMHGKPVWCHIPGDNPAWGIVDEGCVVLGRNHHLDFKYYGEWKAFDNLETLQKKVEEQKKEIRYLKKDNADTIKAILEGSFEM